MTPEQYCQDKAAKSGSSFYYSFLFLPPEQRRAITALYAFCREVDDIVDESTNADLARTKLAWWRTEIGELFHGTAQHPVTRALAPATTKFALPESRFHEIIDGMEMDLDQNRYANFDELKVYCHRVAGVVGLMAADIFGRTRETTLEYAENLGTAFQLTNIIRDVGEDARRNRIYIPLEDLQRFQVDPDDILHGRSSDQFTALIRFQIDRAREFYVRAFAALPDADRRSQRPGLVMAGIYRALLSDIEAKRIDVLTTRASMTPIRKLWIAWRTWLGA
ncbi:MAG: phytoene synthase [Betaproteobacteria bacterium SG8_40]|jgi:phytoene synthase|nr:MAG: phytoene synthase [Betaproteobacteria bacterium SG8_40]